MRCDLPWMMIWEVVTSVFDPLPGIYTMICDIYENVYEIHDMLMRAWVLALYICIWYIMIWPEIRVGRSIGTWYVATVGSVPWTPFWGAWTPGSRERQAWRVSPRWYIRFYSWPTTPRIWIWANVREIVTLAWFHYVFMRPWRISSEYVPDQDVLEMWMALTMIRDMLAELFSYMIIRML